MKYTNKSVGEMLKRELDEGYDVEKIANWAYSLMTSMRDDPNHDVFETLNFIALMDAGPEFENTEKELRLIAERMINGEKEPFKDLF